MTASLVRNGAKGTLLHYVLSVSSHLTRKPSTVYIASRKLDELKKVAANLSKLSPPGAVQGDAVIPIQADVGNKAGCDALAQAIKDKESQMDIVRLLWGFVGYFVGLLTCFLFCLTAYQQLVNLPLK